VAGNSDLLCTWWTGPLIRQICLTAQNGGEDGWPKLLATAGTHLHWKSARTNRGAPKGRDFVRDRPSGLWTIPGVPPQGLTAFLPLCLQMASTRTVGKQTPTRPHPGQRHHERLPEDLRPIFRDFGRRTGHRRLLPPGQILAWSGPWW
jgi:hypothetical protein